MNNIAAAFEKVGIAPATPVAIVPEPLVEARQTRDMPAEVIGLVVHDDFTWSQVQDLIQAPGRRVYLKVAKAEVLRVMDAFTVNEGRIVEVRLQGQEDYRSFAANDCPRVIVVEPKAAPVAKKGKKNRR